MRPFAPLERLLERLFERPGDRLFGGRLEPIVIQRRLERAIDEERRVTDAGTVAPCRFEVVLHPDDAAGLGSDAADLEVSLASAALSHARRRHYGLRERPSVAITADPAVAPGTVVVKARFGGPPGSGRASGDVDPADRTVVRPAQPAPAPRAILAVEEPGHAGRRVAVAGRPLSIGRAADNDLVLADGRVSRRHARIAPRGGHLVLSDLGSTNGTTVNGEPVREIVLGPGDRIGLGATVIVVEADGE
jgi:hypothetical protein